MKLTFWGTRGSIAVPGPDTLRYGGNTTCAQLDLDEGGSVLIDAGTGIRRPGRALAQQEGPVEIDLLITHLHWDHLLGFPFFPPVYRKEVTIRLGGWPKAQAGVAGIFDMRQPDGYFPVNFSDLPSRVEQEPSLSPPRFRVGQTEVVTTPLFHPQGAVGFRFRHPRGDLIFITDNELDPQGTPSDQDIARFCDGARVLIHDCQYLPEEMATRKGRGHSDWRTALELARRAGVERLIFTHHDPDRTDEQVDRLVDEARAEATGFTVEAASEGLVVEV